MAINNQINTLVPTSGQVQSSAFNVGVDSGAADAYVVTLTPAITSYTDGLLIYFIASDYNLTNSPTINVNGVGVVNITGVISFGISPGDIQQGFLCCLQYHSGYGAFTLLNPYISGFSVSNLLGQAYSTGSDSGSANAYVVTLQVDPATFGTGIGTPLSFTPANTNTSTTCTVNVQGNGAQSIIMPNSSDVPIGALKNTVTAYLIYGYNTLGTQGWILQNPQYSSSITYQAEVTLSSAQVLALNATSILLVPGVSGKVVTVTSVVGSLAFNTTAYTGTPTITKLQYGSAAAAAGPTISTIASTFVTAAQNQLTQTVFPAGSFTRTSALSTGVYLSCSTAYSAGNSPIKFYVNYNVITP